MTYTNGQPSAVTPIPGTAELLGVACATPTSCVAVGTNGAGAGVILPITGQTPGSVSLVPGTNELSGVACESSTRCVAVGTNSTGSGVVVPIAFGGAGAVQTVDLTSDLEGISCPSSTTCVAVGTSQDGTHGYVVTIYIDGSLDGLSTDSGFLYGVACVDPNTCFASGLTQSGLSGAITKIVGVTATPTTTALKISPQPGPYGQSQTFTATVTPTSPSSVNPLGKVDFFVNGQDSAILVGSVDLNGASPDQASIPVNIGLAPGNWSAYAVYECCDGNFIDSTSPTVPDTITQGPSKLTAAPASKSIQRFTATLTQANNSAVTIPGQTVTFTARNPLSGAQDKLCTATTGANGVASCTGTIPPLDKTIDTTYTATWTGNSLYVGTSANGTLS